MKYLNSYEIICPFSVKLLIKEKKTNQWFGIQIC